MSKEIFHGDRIEKGTIPADALTASLQGLLGAGTPTDVTYTQLRNLITTNGLVAGSSYCITDYQTIHSIFGLHTAINGTVVAGNASPNSAYGVEPLIVTAKTTNSLHEEVRSTLFPDDIIRYNVLRNPFNGITTRGVITYRKEPVLNIEAGFDFRNCMTRRYRITGAETVSATLTGDLLSLGGGFDLYNGLIKFDAVPTGTDPLRVLLDGEVTAVPLYNGIGSITGERVRSNDLFADHYYMIRATGTRQVAIFDVDDEIRAAFGYNTVYSATPSLSGFTFSITGGERFFYTFNNTTDDGDAAPIKHSLHAQNVSITPDANGEFRHNVFLNLVTNTTLHGEYINNNTFNCSLTTNLHVNGEFLNNTFTGNAGGIHDGITSSVAVSYSHFHLRNDRLTFNAPVSHSLFSQATNVRLGRSPFNGSLVTKNMYLLAGNENVQGYAGQNMVVRNVTNSVLNSLFTNSFVLKAMEAVSFDTPSVESAVFAKEMTNCAVSVVLDSVVLNTTLVNRRINYRSLDGIVFYETTADTGASTLTSLDGSITFTPGDNVELGVIRPFNGTLSGGSKTINLPTGTQQVLTVGADTFAFLSPADYTINLSATPPTLTFLPVKLTDNDRYWGTVLCDAPTLGLAALDIATTTATAVELGAGLVIDGNGKLSATAQTPSLATASTAGIVQPGTGLQVSAGVLSLAPVVQCQVVAGTSSSWANYAFVTGSFDIVPMTNIIVDTHGGWSNALNVYTVPENGYYNITTKFRPQDSLGAGKGFAQGPNSTNADAPHMMWFETYANRNGSYNEWTPYLTAGLQIRLVYYLDGFSFTQYTAEMLIRKVGN